MTEPPTGPRRTDEQAALIATAAADDLSPEQSREYDALVAADPSVADETATLRATLLRVDGLPGWTEVTPDPALGARVRDAVGRQGPLDAVGRTAGREARVSGAGRSSSRRRAGLVAAAVALLALGGVGGALVGEALRDAPVDPARTDAPEGPPGTLGALEPIEFTGEPDAVDIEAELVAHTWGTETVLGMSGWEPGASYRLVLLDTEGDVAESGTFRGSEVTILCRMNGDLLREDVDALEIRDADGAVVARSDVPDVTRG